MTREDLTPEEQSMFDFFKNLFMILQPHGADAK